MRLRASVLFAFFKNSESTFALALARRRQMFRACAIDLSICRPVCQKRDISIKGWRRDSERPAPSEMKFLICSSSPLESPAVFSRSFHCPVSPPRTPPPTTCFLLRLLLIALLLLFYLQVSLSLPCLHYSLPFSFPPFPQICLISPFPPPFISFLLVLLDRYISHSLFPRLSLSPSLSDSFFLSVSSLYLCLRGETGPIGEPSVSLCPPVPRAGSCDGA